MTFRGLIFDVDGTLIRGSEAVPGAAEVVRELQSRGLPIRILTNNSTATPGRVAEKLAALGFEFAAEHIATSATVAAHALAAEGVTSAHVVGEDGLRAALLAARIEVRVDGPADVVIVGLCRHFTYEIMDQALEVLRGGAKLVATNGDLTFPREGGRFSPGAGAIVAGMAACSGQTPRVFGKPEPEGVRQLCADMGLSPSEVICVGDREDTDMAAAMAAGCQQYLVPTGVTAVIPSGVRGGPLEDLLKS